MIFLPCSGQDDSTLKGLNAISQDVLRAQMGFLASDWTEGREAGTRGEYLAGEYIASLLQLYGVKPGGDIIRRGYLSAPETTYFQNFTLLKTVQGDKHELEIITTDGSSVRTVNLAYNTDFFFRSTGRQAEIEAPVVFVGYGFKNSSLNYDDYKDIDVKGKFILKISGVPEFARNKLTSSDISTSMRDIERMLRERGAAGVLDFNPDIAIVGTAREEVFLNMSPAEENPRSWNPNIRYSLPERTGYASFPIISISSKVAAELLNGSGIDIEEYKKEADQGKQQKSLRLTSKKISFKSDAVTTSVRVRNIIGVIEGKDTEQVIVLGAHYDHEGIKNGYIWNGADDNASGTVGILTLAKAIMETGVQPEKTIIIALWTAEEKGLLGSRYYVDNLPYPKKNLRLNLNFDMISRYITDDKPNQVTMTFSDTCPEFRELTEENMKKYGIELDVSFEASDNPPGGSDHRSFVEAGIPVMRFKPGHREEYHTPYDEIETVDWDIMEKIVRIAFTNIWKLADTGW